jgi:hypothetical protein
VLLVISAPFVRFLEAALRARFMSEHYGSFADGLKMDVWFSDGWWAYVGTPLGLGMTLLPVALVSGAIICFVFACKAGRTARSR